jgi:hypothetical protein
MARCIAREWTAYRAGGHLRAPDNGRGVLDGFRYGDELAFECFVFCAGQGKCLLEVSYQMVEIGQPDIQGRVNLNAKEFFDCGQGVPSLNIDRPMMVTDQHLIVYNTLSKCYGLNYAQYSVNETSASARHRPQPFRKTRVDANHHRNMHANGAGWPWRGTSPA